MVFVAMQVCLGYSIRGFPLKINKCQWVFFWTLVSYHVTQKKIHPPWKYTCNLPVSKKNQNNLKPMFVDPSKFGGAFVKAVGPDVWQTPPTASHLALLLTSREWGVWPTDPLKKQLEKCIQKIMVCSSKKRSNIVGCFSSKVVFPDSRSFLGSDWRLNVSGAIPMEEILQWHGDHGESKEVC